MKNSTDNTRNAHDLVNQWLENIVIGLNLCPFAARPQRENRIRIHVNDSDNHELLLHGVYDELRSLEEMPVSEVETTLFVFTRALGEFDEYLDFLYLAEQMLESSDWQGVFQIASFHPDYCFEGTDPEDASNLTNRSPCPILHLIREDSLEKAIASYPNTSDIPERNIQKMHDLTVADKQRLFHYLFTE